MDERRRTDILATYELYASIFDEVARRRARTVTLTTVRPVSREPGRGAHGRDGMAPPELTVRMREVLRLIADGHSNKVIAARLSIGAETVKSHVQKLLSVLQAENRAHAVAIGYRTGLLRDTGAGSAAAAAVGE